MIAVTRKWKKMLKLSTLTMPQNPRPGRLRLVERGSNRRHRADQRDEAEQFLAAALVHQRIEHHDDHAEDRKHNFRQNADVFDALRQGLSHSGGDHWPTTLLATCANGASAVWTAGSIAFSHSSGATPITSAATAAGHKRNALAQIQIRQCLIYRMRHLSEEHSLIHPQQITCAPDHAGRAENAVNRAMPETLRSAPEIRR